MYPEGIAAAMNTYRGLVRKTGTEFLVGHVAKGNGFKLKKGIFRLDIRKNLLQ